MDGHKGNARKRSRDWPPDLLTYKRRRKMPRPEPKPVEQTLTQRCPSTLSKSGVSLLLLEILNYRLLPLYRYQGKSKALMSGVTKIISMIKGKCGEHHLFRLAGNLCMNLILSLRDFFLVKKELKVDVVYFCNQCHILMCNEKDIVQHFLETSHAGLCVSLSQEHKLICVKCRASFSSVIELKEHTKMGEEDHSVFKRIAPPPEQEDQAVLEDEEIGFGNMEGADDEDGDKEIGFSNTEEADDEYELNEEDEDELIEKDDERADPMYDCSLNNVKKDIIVPSDTDDSEYADQSSEQIMQPGRTLKNLNINAGARRILRKTYVIAEAVSPDVALKRVQRALDKFDKVKKFTLRRKVYAIDPVLQHVCFKKTTKGILCGKQRSDRLQAVLVMIRKFLIQEVKEGGVRGNSLHYRYPSELNEPNLKESLQSRRVAQAITDISAMLRISRESLGVRAAPRGSIRGAVKLYRNEEMIADCLVGGDSGTQIPSEADLITKINATAEIRFVLVLEKDTIFHQLTKVHFDASERCILLTGKGQPDVATRILLRKLRDKFPNIPFYALVDSNPSGAGIFCTYCLGSEERAHDNLFLTVHDLKFIGLYVSNVKVEDRKVLHPAEKKRVSTILRKRYLPLERFSGLRYNLAQMIKQGKADIDVLCKTENMLVGYIRHQIKNVGDVPACARSLDGTDMNIDFSRGSIGRVDPMFSSHNKFLKDVQASCDLDTRASASASLSGRVDSMGLIGLENLGNTCFMNSAIQCLAHTTDLVDYFLGDYAKDINQTSKQKGELAFAFGELVKNLWTNGDKPVAPHHLKEQIAIFAPRFTGFEQEDSHEFLVSLLAGLHEDLNRAKSKLYEEVKDSSGRPDEEVANEYWNNYAAREDSLIIDTCQGQYKSTLTCPTCSKTSVTFDPFMYLSLPLPRAMAVTVFSTDFSKEPFSYDLRMPQLGTLSDLVQALSSVCTLGDDETLLIMVELSDSELRDGDKLAAFRLPRHYNTLLLNKLELMTKKYLVAKHEIHKLEPMTKKSNDCVSLHDCLQAFVKEEPLRPENKWHCPSCKKDQQAVKKIDLWRLPEVLIIQLKRFSELTAGNKIQTFVDFPISDLDLSTYIAAKTDQPNRKYHLYAISDHSGNLKGGHYTASINHENKWFKFDDASVTNISEDPIITAAAYVLFYRRERG